jgi:hypothetical protein
MYYHNKERKQVYGPHFVILRGRPIRSLIYIHEALVECNNASQIWSHPIASSSKSSQDFALRDVEAAGNAMMQTLTYTCIYTELQSQA